MEIGNFDPKARRKAHIAKLEAELKEKYPDPPPKPYPCPLLRSEEELKMGGQLGIIMLVVITVVGLAAPILHFLLCE